MLEECAVIGEFCFRFVACVIFCGYVMWLLMTIFETVFDGGLEGCDGLGVEC